MASETEQAQDFAEALAALPNGARVAEPAARFEFAGVVQAFEAQLASTVLGVSPPGNLVAATRGYAGYRYRTGVTPAHAAFTPFDM